MLPCSLSELKLLRPSRRIPRTYDKPGVRQICRELPAGCSRLPEFFPAVAHLPAAQGDDGISSPDCPSYPRMFEASPHNRLAACLYHSRSYKETSATKLGVAHALGISPKIGNLFTDLFPTCRVVGTGPFIAATAAPTLPASSSS